ncbi:MAG: PilN domain-containing protein [Deltaproteobacteria bacterium]|nr:PilN domain-containing protein [Deltaproteobacteria bacterium]
MIRINLLPVRHIRKVHAGQRQLLLFIVLVVVEFGAMAGVYLLKDWEVESNKKQVATLQQEIEALKREVGDYDRLRQQRDRLISQRNVINTLQKARSGPVWMLKELSDILSVGKGPTVDQTRYETVLRKDPTMGFNPRWNARRLWFEKFEDRSGTIALEGKAKDYDDVAELMKRLGVSEYFADVQLIRNDQVMDPGLGIKVVKFSMTCKFKN